MRGRFRQGASAAFALAAPAGRAGGRGGRRVRARPRTVRRWSRRAARRSSWSRSWRNSAEPAASTIDGEEAAHGAAPHVVLEAGEVDDEDRDEEELLHLHGEARVRE